MENNLLNVIVGIYLISIFWISFYGYHNLVLAILYLAKRKHADQPMYKHLKSDGAWPKVTIQLPMFNEKYVVERLIETVTNLDYPKELMQIQVLDDSTDDTAGLVTKLVNSYREKGFDIENIHRENREGYKAGALDHGLKSATGEFIAIFDADFIPPRDWLKRLLPCFDDPKTGCVQSRWGHINSSYSRLTKAIALSLDGHFIIEQSVRSNNHLLMGFNGSSGMWRRACIDDSGGWKMDTLTEDLDLSYRAQMRGWRFKYMPDVVVPAELPMEMAAFKQQQYRWAKGSIQTVRKLLPVLLRSDLPAPARLMGMLHITAYIAQMLMIIILLCYLPVGLHEPGVLKLFPWTMVASFGPPLLYAITKSEATPHWYERLKLIPLLVMIGFGLSLNSTVAILDALFSNTTGNFTRTPKINMLGYTRKIIDRNYQVNFNPILLGELGLAIYAALTFYLLLPRLGLGGVTWIAFYVAGYLYVAGMNIYQEWQINHQPAVDKKQYSLHG